MASLTSDFSTLLIDAMSMSLTVAGLDGRCVVVGLAVCLELLHEPNDNAPQTAKTSANDLTNDLNDIDVGVII